jgi:hypothetical protein
MTSLKELEKNTNGLFYEDGQPVIVNKGLRKLKTFVPFVHSNHS